jgi:hypothetical protein
MRGYAFSEPAGFVFGQGLQFYVDHFATYPLASIVLQTPSGEVVKISDFFSERVWQRNEWYNEVCRPVRLWDQIIFNLAPSDSPLVCDLVALNAPRAFTERDRSMLHLLRPHLRQALLKAQAITRMQEELDQVRKAVEAMDRGIVVLAETGRIGLITSKARQLITEYFAAPRADRLPEALDSWARYQKSLLAEKDDIPASTKPLVVARDEKKLVVRLEERQPERSLETCSKIGSSRSARGRCYMRSTWSGSTRRRAWKTVPPR